MNEAKSLVEMCVSALFAALILVAVLALIFTGQLLWRAFSSQNDANNRLQEYSKYSAFDGTEVRGQDVIALMHDVQGDPYIIVLDGTNKPIMVAYCDITASLKVNDSIQTNAGSNDTVSGLLAGLCNGLTLTVSDVVTRVNNTTTSPTITYDFSTTATSPSYSEVQEFFLSRGEYISGSSGYTKYESYLLYDGDATTDIVGVLLREMN